METLPEFAGNPGPEGDNGSLGIQRVDCDVLGNAYPEANTQYAIGS